MTRTPRMVRIRPSISAVSALSIAHVVHLGGHRLSVFYSSAQRKYDLAGEIATLATSASTFIVEIGVFDLARCETCRSKDPGLARDEARNQRSAVRASAKREVGNHRSDRKKSVLAGRP